MMSTGRFNFGRSGEEDAAAKLFENSDTLNMTLTRGKGVYGPLLIYELRGGFTTKDGDLLAIAAELLHAFSALPRLEAGGDDDE